MKDIEFVIGQLKMLEDGINDAERTLDLVNFSTFCQSSYSIIIYWRLELKKLRDKKRTVK